MGFYDNELVPSKQRLTGKAGDPVSYHVIYFNGLITVTIRRNEEEI